MLESFLVLLLSTSILATPTATTTSTSLNSISTGKTIPLYRHGQLLRRSNSDALRSWALREKGRVLGKYGEVIEIQKRQGGGGFSTAGTATAPLATATSSTINSTAAAIPTSPVGLVKVNNFEADLEYFASVGVGVPAQFMNVILDTGSADLWIASSNCTATTGCTGIPTLNVSQSITSLDMNTTFAVKYGSGSAEGGMFQDYVSFGGYNVSSQGYALCNTVSSDLLTGSISGLMGLGFQSLAASGVTPLWQNLFQAGVLPSFPGFAFYLTRFVNITNAAAVEPGGSLTFGYLNQSLYIPPINYIPIPEGMKSYWLIPLQAITVNGTNVTELGTPNVAIDTGTTLIGGPSSVVRQIYNAIPGALAATGAYQGYYSYPCATNVNVSMTFGGMVYNITSDDFNLGPFGKTNNISTCLGAFFDLSLASTSQISWVVGAAFLKNVYSVYRASPPAVGFASLSHNSSAIYSSSYNGTGYPNTTLISNIPNGFYGPSGVTSLKTTVTANTITTAIQAGQTAIRPVPLSASGVRRFSLSAGGSWKEGSIGLLVASGLIIALTF